MKAIDRHNRLLDIVRENPDTSSSELMSLLDEDVNLVTIKRDLTKLTFDGLLIKSGKGRATKYRIGAAHGLFSAINPVVYFEKELDDRDVSERFNFELIRIVLPEVNLFTADEMSHLQKVHQAYVLNISALEPEVYSKEIERLGIDLIWKSSQIEGNTYSLLETELLIKEKKEAEGKARVEATMLLNHKSALDMIISDPSFVRPLTVGAVEELHAVLVEGLGVQKNIRKRLVGITGTKYRPIDNEFQIKEALNDMCSLVNSRENVLEKALLAVVLISYIQPFADGNKRTARMISNALLICDGYCPLSYRTVDSLDYKKAMLLFYEQNHLQTFKELFMGQFEFAVENYFG